MTHLPSLLIRDGIVDPRHLEQAIQHQVIHGVGLDTSLLELALIDEPRLSAVISDATELPLATAEHTRPDPDAQRAANEACSRELARSFDVVPAQLSGNTLHVVVPPTVDGARLSELRASLKVEVEAHVAPEFRYSVVRARWLDEAPDPRFAELDSANPLRSTQKKRKPKKAVTRVEETRDPVEAEAAAPAVEPERAAEPEVEASQQASASEDEPVERKSAKGRKSKKGDKRKGKKGRGKKDVSAADRAEVAEPAAAEVAEPTAAEVAEPAAAEVAEPAAAEVAEPAAAEVAEAVSPLEPDAARAALERADDRDVIFSVFLRAIRARTSYAALLTVQKGKIAGRIAIDEDTLDEEVIKSVSFAAEGATAFQQVLHSAAPYFGPLGARPEVVESLSRMGGTVPLAAVLLPIAISNRVVAIAVGHRKDNPLQITDVSDLLPLCGNVAEAFASLLRKAKSRK